MQTRKGSGPSTEHRGTPTKTGLLDDFCPLKITLWNLTGR